MQRYENLPAVNGGVDIHGRLDHFEQQLRDFRAEMRDTINDLRDQVSSLRTGMSTRYARCDTSMLID